MLFHIPSFNFRNMKWKLKGHGQKESDHFKLATPLLRSVSLWSSAPIHPLAHLWIALRNNSLSDDHLTKYLTKCETDQKLFWYISYLKKSSQLKMGQRYSSSHILQFQFPQGHFHSAMSHSKIWASRLATHAHLDELMNFVLGLWLQAYIEASVKKA